MNAAKTNAERQRELLQHSSKKVTETHYRTKPTRVRPVR